MGLLLTIASKRPGAEKACNICGCSSMEGHLFMGQGTAAADGVTMVNVRLDGACFSELHLLGNC